MVVVGGWLILSSWFLLVCLFAWGNGPYLPFARGQLPTSAGGWPEGTGHIPQGKLKTDIKTKSHPYFNDDAHAAEQGIHFLLFVYKK